MLASKLPTALSEAAPRSHVQQHVVYIGGDGAAQKERSSSGGGHMTPSSVAGGSTAQEVLIAGTTYVLTSAGLILFNKRALSSFNFQCPNCLLFFHCLMAVVMVQACSVSLPSQRASARAGWGLGWGMDVWRPAGEGLRCQQGSRAAVALRGRSAERRRGCGDGGLIPPRSGGGGSVQRGGNSAQRVEWRLRVLRRPAGRCGVPSVPWALMSRAACARAWVASPQVFGLSKQPVERLRWKIVQLWIPVNLIFVGMIATSFLALQLVGVGEARRQGGLGAPGTHAARRRDLSRQRVGGQAGATAQAGRQLGIP